MTEFFDSLPVLLSTYGLKIITALVIVVVGRWVAMFIRKSVRKALIRKNIDATVTSFSCSLAYAMLLAFIIVAALGQLGVQTSSIVAILGATALAIGLALQGSLSNLSAGVILMVTRPFKIGDYIESGGDSGIVELINLLATTLKTVDNKRVVVPNSKLIASSITNYTAENIRRVDLKVKIAHTCDMKSVMLILLDELVKDERVLKDPAPFVGMLDMTDSSVDLAVRPWVKTSDYLDVFFALNENIKLRLDAEGISIPFPRRDIHLYNTV
jgi:small conductance mechanosensitive channel